MSLIKVYKSVRNNIFGVVICADEQAFNSVIGELNKDNRYYEVVTI